MLGSPWPYLAELLDLVFLLHAHPARPLQEVLGPLPRLLLQLAQLPHLLLQDGLLLRCTLALTHCLLRGQAGLPNALLGQPCEAEPVQGCCGAA